MLDSEGRRESFFGGFVSRERHFLARLFKEVSLPANHVVVRQGDVPEGFYLVEEGTVVVFRDGGEGDPVQLLTCLGPGDHFGELGLCAHRVGSASVRTSEPCRCLRLSRQTLCDVLPEHPTLGLRLPTAGGRSRAAGLSRFSHRREVRTRVDRPVGLMLADGTSTLTRLVDLSRGGLCLNGAPPDWETGRTVRFHLGLGSIILQLAGQVAWSRDDAVGVAFKERSQGHNMKIQWALRQLVEPPPQPN